MTYLKFWKILSLICIQICNFQCEGNVNTIKIVFKKNYNYIQVFPIDKDACNDTGILIVNVRISVDNEHTRQVAGCGNHQASREVSYNDEEERKFLIVLKRECNGRLRCELLESTKNQLSVNCNRSKVEIEAIEIKYQCKPITPNNVTVFDIIKDNYWWINSSKNSNIYYLVLKTSSQHVTRRNCRVESNGGQIYVRLLYVDWGPSCYSDGDGSATYYIKAGERKFFFCKYFDMEGRSNFPAYFKLEINSKSSLVWIELEVNERFSVQSASEDVINKSPPSSVPSESTAAFNTITTLTTTSTPMTQAAETTANVNIGSATTLADRTSTPIILVTIGHRPIAESKREPGTFLTIPIVSGVISTLTFITVIILIIVFCKRKRKNQNLPATQIYSAYTPRNSDQHLYHECLDVHPYAVTDITQEDAYVELEESYISSTN